MKCPTFCKTCPVSLSSLKDALSGRKKRNEKEGMAVPRHGSGRYEGDHSQRHLEGSRSSVTLIRARKGGVERKIGAADLKKGGLGQETGHRIGVAKMVELCRGRRSWGEGAAEFKVRAGVCKPGGPRNRQELRGAGKHDSRAHFDISAICPGLKT